MNWTGRFVAGALLSVLALSASGCTRSPEASPVAVARSGGPAVEPLAFDPTAVLTAANTFGSQSETTAPSELSAQDAIAAATAVWRSLESTPTYITSSKVVYSDSEVKNRVAWLVGAAPVVARTHGLTPGTRSARAVYVVDATTGKILAMNYGSFMAEK